MVSYELRTTACPHPIPSDHQLVMDSLPQEIVDEIIDNFPRSSLRSSSLLAKRWRTRSEQRALYNILFAKESMVNGELLAHGHPERLRRSLVLRPIHNFTEWRDPALLISQRKDRKLTAAALSSGTKKCTENMYCFESLKRT